MREYAFVREARDLVPEGCTVVEYVGTDERAMELRFARIGEVRSGERLSRRYQVLPAFAPGVGGETANATNAVLEQDYVRVARAKGASSFRAMVVHGLRMALVPIATLAVLDLGALVGGAVVTERIFRWPGLGQMAVEAVVNRDGQLVTATVLVAAVAMIAATLLVDVLVALLDPRVDRS